MRLAYEVKKGDETLLSTSALATRSYSAEFTLGNPEPAVLAKLSSLSRGRGEIKPSQAFDRDDLRVGRSSFSLAGWFLLLAALLWPVAVALSRIAMTAQAAGASKVFTKLSHRLPKLPALPGRGNSSPPTQSPQPSASMPEPPPPPTIAEEPTTIDRLLKKKRGEVD